MGRLTTVVVSFSIVVIAIAATLALSLLIDISLSEMITIGLAVMLLLVIINTRIVRMYEQRQLRAQLEDLQRISTQFGRDVSDTNFRFDTLDRQIEETVSKRLEPLVEEIELLGALVKQLTDAAAEQDGRLTVIETANSPDRSEKSISVGDKSPAKPIATADDVVANQASATPLRGAASDNEVIDAINADHLDVHLQPIVSLPQRKPLYYEVLTRLRGENGDLLLPDDFMPIVQRAELMPKLDNQIMFRAVKILRRLQSRNQDIGLMCNIAPASFASAEFFGEFSAFMAANRVLNENLYLEFSQAHFSAMEAEERERLNSLKELGFRFSLDQVSDIRLEFPQLADRGFRFVKIAASIMLDQDTDTAADIHIADISDLAARHGIGLIVDRIEAESHVVDLLDMDVRLGQGYLFSEPKPVRAEIYDDAGLPDPQRLPA